MFLKNNISVKLLLWYVIYWRLFSVEFS